MISNSNERQKPLELFIALFPSIVYDCDAQVGKGSSHAQESGPAIALLGVHTALNDKRWRLITRFLGMKDDLSEKGVGLIKMVQKPVSRCCFGEKRQCL